MYLEQPSIRLTNMSCIRKFFGTTVWDCFVRYRRGREAGAEIQTPSRLWRVPGVSEGGWGQWWGHTRLHTGANAPAEEAATGWRDLPPGGDADALRAKLPVSREKQEISNLLILHYQ